MKKFLFTLLIMFTSANVFSQKEHFGLMLGAHYKVGDIGRNFKSFYGDYADCGGSGDFYQVRLYFDFKDCPYKCNKEGATFGSCTINFYKGRFWKISYEDIKNDPNKFAEELEWKFSNYSISETEYEYRCGDIYFDFNGQRLFYVHENVYTVRTIMGY